MTIKSSKIIPVLSLEITKDGMSELIDGYGFVGADWNQSLSTIHLYEDDIEDTIQSAIWNKEELSETVAAIINAVKQVDPSTYEYVEVWIS